MKLYKSDSINIKIAPALKQKFHIAIGMLSASAVITSFIQDYVRKYELQYNTIPVALSEDEIYDIVTKMFGVSLDRASKRKANVKVHLKLLNEILGSEITEELFLELSKKYPKTRKNIHIFNDNKSNLSRQVFLDDTRDEDHF